MNLLDLELRNPAGATVRLGDLIDKPTLLVLPRYYG